MTTPDAPRTPENPFSFGSLTIQPLTAEEQVKWDRWDALSAIEDRLWEDVKNYMVAIRKQGFVSRRVVISLLDRYSAFEQSVRGDELIDVSAKQEFLEFTGRWVTLLRYIRAYAPQIKPPSNDAINATISASKNPWAASPPTARRATLHLLLLSRPVGSEYWSIAKGLRRDIEQDLRSTEPQSVQWRELQRVRRVLQCAIPAAFDDRVHTPSLSRYGAKATRVTSIVSGGLPGLGRTQ